VGLSATIWAFMHSRADAAEERELRITAATVGAAAEIERRTTSYLEILYGLRGLYAASDEVTRDEFSSYVTSNHLALRYPGVQALEFTRVVPTEDTQRFEAAVRRDTSLVAAGYPNFEVHPDTGHSERFIVDFVVPHEGNVAAFGYDLGTNPVRRESVEEARDTGRAIATEGISLVQGDGEEVGFLMIVPVYDPPSPPDSVAVRRETFLGVVNGVFIVDRVLTGIAAEHPGVRLAIYDTGRTDQPPTPTERNSILLDRNTSDSFMTSGSSPNPSQVATIEVGGRWWTVVLEPAPGSPLAAQSVLPWVILLGGALLAASGAALVYSLARSRARALALAESMTAELQESTRQLRAVHDKAVAADESKTRFLANMSHELRTPLTGVLGLSSLLQMETSGPLNDKQAEYVEHIAESGDHLLSLINDLLDLAKIESGKQELDLRQVEPTDVIAESLSLVRELAASRGIDLVEETHPGLSPITVDNRRLKQVLVNLLSNAIKFTPPGGKVGIETHESREDFEFIVWDTGSGIPIDKIDAVFRPFEQAHNGHSGTGLGLPLSRTLIEMHGGTLTATSEVGIGSRFVVTLPAPTNIAIDGATTPANGPALYPLAIAASDNLRPRVLVVDDDPVNRMVLQEFLSSKGFVVELAVDGAEVVTAIRRSLPDIVLMDIRMPRMDGLEATRRIRATPQTAEVGVIIVSAHAMPEDRKQGAAAGCDAFLPKPIDHDQLEHTITAVLERRKSGAALATDI